MWRNRINENHDENSLIHDPQANNYDSISTVRVTDNEGGVAHLGDSGYTELLRGSVPCPTCKGLGNVPKEQEGQLIALIPMKDKRLQPRRTHLWVALAVFLCLTAAGLLMFFLFPRDVTMTSTRPYLKPVGYVYINETEDYVNFAVMNFITVKNENYVQIKIESVKVTMLYDTQVITEATNTSSMDIPIRSGKEYSVLMNITLNTENQMGYMAPSCKNKLRWVHEMVMLFEFTLSYEILGHSEQTTLEVFQFVSCYSNEKPTTPKPLTTMPTTVVTTTKKPSTT